MSTRWQDLQTAAAAVTAAPCPTCGLGDGFHDHGEPSSRHDAYTVPAELLLPARSDEGRRRDVHRPYTDDGVDYCGLATDGGMIDGCGELWPCSTVRAVRAERGAS